MQLMFGTRFGPELNTIYSNLKDGGLITPPVEANIQAVLNDGKKGYIGVEFVSTKLSEDTIAKSNASLFLIDDYMQKTLIEASELKNITSFDTPKNELPIIKKLVLNLLERINPILVNMGYNDISTAIDGEVIKSSLKGISHKI